MTPFPAELTSPTSTHTTIGRRLVVLLAVGIAAATVAACGSSSSGGGPDPSPVGTPTTSTSPSPTAPPITVGSKSLQRSTLAKGTHEFQLNKQVSETAAGLELSIKPNQQVEAFNASSQGLTSSLEIGVMVTPSTTPGLLYGIGCEGDYADFGDQYSGVTDSDGHWQLVEQRAGKSTLLTSGTATVSGSDLQLNLACIALPDTPNTTRLSFAIDGTIVGGVDHTDSHMSTGNAFQLILADPGTGAGGTATFHHLDVRTATAHS
jgi:hypothetical protein